MFLHLLCTSESFIVFSAALCIWILEHKSIRLLTLTTTTLDWTKPCGFTLQSMCCSSISSESRQYDV